MYNNRALRHRGINYIRLWILTELCWVEDNKRITEYDLSYDAFLLLSRGGTPWCQDEAAGSQIHSTAYGSTDRAPWHPAGTTTPIAVVFIAESEWKTLTGRAVVHPLNVSPASLLFLANCHRSWGRPPDQREAVLRSVHVRGHPHARAGLLGRPHLAGAAAQQRRDARGRVRWVPPPLECHAVRVLHPCGSPWIHSGVSCSGTHVRATSGHLF